MGSGHAEVEGNERADEAAKQAARGGHQCTERFASLAHVSKCITVQKWKECRIWFKSKHRKRSAATRATYQLTHQNQSLNITASRSQKSLVSRYYQLKSNHAHIRAYLYRIGKIENSRCTDCSGAFQQTVRHLMPECRKWRRERENMWKQLKKDGSELQKGRVNVKELFGDTKATGGILRFLKETAIGRKNNLVEEMLTCFRRENLGIEDLDQDREESDE